MHMHTCNVYNTSGAGRGGHKIYKFHRRCKKNVLCIYKSSIIMKTINQETKQINVKVL